MEILKGSGVHVTRGGHGWTPDKTRHSLDRRSKKLDFTLERSFSNQKWSVQWNSLRKNIFKHRVVPQLLKNSKNIFAKKLFIFPIEIITKMCGKTEYYWIVGGDFKGFGGARDPGGARLDPRQNTKFSISKLQKIRFHFIGFIFEPKVVSSM